jgi:hypothetical protein
VLSVRVNQALNKIYVSGNPNANTGLEVVVIDRATSAAGTDVGFGQQVGVDNKTNRYWTETLCDGTVIVRDGTTNSTVKTISLGSCPMQSSYDFEDSRMWVSAQGGAGNDPVFAIDGKTLKITAGPIGSGGIMDSAIANGVNGRLYLTINSGMISKRVDPATFAVTVNAFGGVKGIDGSTNTLYAVPLAQTIGRS